MKLNEYQEVAKRTARSEGDNGMNLLNWALGLGGEVGEFQNLVKKMTFHRHPVPGEELAGELGDALWYLAVAADTLGYTLEDIAQMNLGKVAKRYPEGFSPERSRNREENMDASHRG